MHMYIYIPEASAYMCFNDKKNLFDECLHAFVFFHFLFILYILNVCNLVANSF